MYEQLLAFDQWIRAHLFLPGTWTPQPGAEHAAALYFTTWAPMLHRPAALLIGSEVDDSIDRLHVDIMAFGQALIDRLYIPGTWRLKPGMEASDAYRFDQQIWEPFLREWMRFRSEKREIPLQTLPGSGTAGDLRRFRERFAGVIAQAQRDWILSGTGYVPPAWATAR